MIVSLSFFCRRIHNETIVLKKIKTLTSLLAKRFKFNKFGLWFFFFRICLITTSSIFWIKMLPLQTLFASIYLVIIRFTKGSVHI